MSNSQNNLQSGKQPNEDEIKNSHHENENVPVDNPEVNILNNDTVLINDNIDNDILLKVGTISDLREKEGYYEGQEIVLLGYYVSGDKSPLIYKFTTQNFSTLVDDGGAVVKTTLGSWIAQFNGKCDIKDFGAIKDTDCTNIVNKALLLVDEITISDSYKVNPIGYTPTTVTNSFTFTGGIKPRTGNTIIGGLGNKLYIDPTSEQYATIINLERVNFVKLIGLTLEGDVINHLGNTGEWNYGISIKGCDDIDIIDCTSTHFWGDGIAIQTSKKYINGTVDINYSNRVRMIGGEFNYNRRNGISIISCNKFYGENLVAKYNGTINGINPRYGIDIEPNNGGDDYIDVVINGVYTEGNSEGGIEIVPAYMQDVRYINTAVFKVKIDNWVSKSDAASSERRGTLRVVCADTTIPTIVETKPIKGYINITNSTIIDSGRRPVSFSRVSDNGMSITLINTTIINPCTLETDGSVEVNNALAFSTASINTSYGNIFVDGYHISDKSNNLSTGVYFKPANETDGFKNVTVKGLRYEGQWNHPNEVPSYGAVDKSVSVEFSELPKIVLNTSGVLSDYSVANYMEIIMMAPNAIVSLPDSTKVKRKRIKYIANISSNQVCYLEGKNDNQPININPRNSRRIVLNGGSTITVDISDNGTWNIINYSGVIYNEGFPVKGATSQRPSGLSASNAGFIYYDTSLKNYINWDGASWVLPNVAKWINITTNTYDLYVMNRRMFIEITPPGPSPTICKITLKKLAEHLEGSEVDLINNSNLEIQLVGETPPAGQNPIVYIMGNGAYVNKILLKPREVVKLYSNGLNSWRIYNVNRISNHIDAVSTADPGASYDSTTQALLLELKTKVNAMLSSEITAGQRASS